MMLLEMTSKKGKIMNDLDAMVDNIAQMSIAMYFTELVAELREMEQQVVRLNVLLPESTTDISEAIAEFCNRIQDVAIREVNK